jgi:L-fuculose-phosphate aldolase
MWDNEAKRIGKRLHIEGLVSGNFGNLSIRNKVGFYIKHKDAYLDMPGPLVFVPFEGPIPREASHESIVHRQIYQVTPAKAVIHAHPPHAIALSFLCEEVNPCDCEGELLCPSIPVVEGASGTLALSRAVADRLRTSPAVIVRGHGTFASGATLDESYVITSAVEHACRILVLLRQIHQEKR